MFLNTLVVGLQILVVSTCVNLNGMNVHVKNWKVKIWSVHWFGLTELNKTMGRMYGRKIAKHRRQMKFCNSHLTCNVL